MVPWLSYSQLDPRFTGSNPAGVDEFFQSVKILSMTSFEREIKPWVPCRRFTARKKTSDHLFGIVVNTSDYPPRGPGFDSRLYPRNFTGSIGSGTGSTQPREEN